MAKIKRLNFPHITSFSPKYLHIIYLGLGDKTYFSLRSLTILPSLHNPLHNQQYDEMIKGYVSQHPEAPAQPLCRSLLTFPGPWPLPGLFPAMVHILPLRDFSDSSSLLVPLLCFKGQLPRNTFSQLFKISNPPTIWDQTSFQPRNLIFNFNSRDLLMCCNTCASVGMYVYSHRCETFPFLHYWG